jgi:hypothetical protein
LALYCLQPFPTDLAVGYTFSSISSMAYHQRNNGQSLAGSCPCSSVSWTTTTLPSSMAICHCSQCRNSSSTNAPIAYGSFSNECIRFTSDAAYSGSTTTPTLNVTTLKTEKAARGICEHCGTIIYMKYHCSPTTTDLNMGLCVDECALRDVRSAKHHIFFDGRVGEDERSWKGLSDDLAETMTLWEQQGRKKRSDV